MAEEERQQSAIEAKAEQPDGGADAEDEDDDGVSSPFDHPAFLPVLLWALALWFGYDGWINQDPDMLEHVNFNRYGFGILFVLGTYFTVQAIRESRRSGSDS